jgi:magnesium-transporting ATPase (P-type)
MFHVVLSLVGIVAGLIVLGGMLGSKKLEGWTALFLATTVLTSATGFLFPFVKILPSHIVGVISLAVLAVAIVALYVCRLAGRWRWIYVASAVFALYLNAFVGVVQAFLKIPSLKAMAPTQVGASVCHRPGRRARGYSSCSANPGGTIVSPETGAPALRTT